MLHRSNGVAFLAGILNGAYAIGTPDSVTHMAEEVPNPRRDLPKAIAMQLILGTLSKSQVNMLLKFSLKEDISWFRLRSRNFVRRQGLPGHPGLEFKCCVPPC
jgi:hypothetical protein